VKCFAELLAIENTLLLNKRPQIEKKIKEIVVSLKSND